MFCLYCLYLIDLFLCFVVVLRLGVVCFGFVGFCVLGFGSLRFASSLLRGVLVGCFECLGGV